MSREKEHYRENLAMLYEKFGQKDFLMLDEVCAFLRCDRRTVIKAEGFPIKKLCSTYRIPITGFARWLS